MSMVSFDSSAASVFVRPAEVAMMENAVNTAKDCLLGKSGAGNDFLGWIDLPVDYDKE